MAKRGDGRARAAVLSSEDCGSMVLQKVMAKGKRASMQVEAAFECRRASKIAPPGWVATHEESVSVQLENA
jgi:hypothetical protein